MARASEDHDHSSNMVMILSSGYSPPPLDPNSKKISSWKTALTLLISYIFSHEVTGHSTNMAGRVKQKSHKGCRLVLMDAYFMTTMLPGTQLVLKYYISTQVYIDGNSVLLQQGKRLVIDMYWIVILCYRNYCSVASVSHVLYSS